MNYRTPISVLVTALFVLLPLYAQDRKEKTTNGAAPPPPPANLKVLKVSTREEAEQIMRTFASGLGVQCNYCHVLDFASDENTKKEVARRWAEPNTRCPVRMRA